MKISKGRWLLILGIVLVVIDQVIKVLVKTNMTIGENFNVIGDWFKILFIENEGMAFGLFFALTVNAHSADAGCWGPHSEKTSSYNFTKKKVGGILEVSPKIRGVSWQSKEPWI